jgi:Condensation domain
VTEATVDRVGHPPLSVAQEGLWYLSLLAPNQISYNETITIRKDGPFDVAAFRRAFNEVVRRHEAWHTTFDNIDGQPVQIVGAAPHYELPLLDLAHLTFEQAERRAVRWSADMSMVPYDVRRGPLLRPRLVRFPGRHHQLYLALPHMIFDGVSLYRVVLPELIALYDAFSPAGPRPSARSRRPSTRPWPASSGRSRSPSAAPSPTPACTSSTLTASPCRWVSPASCSWPATGSRPATWAGRT